MSRCEIHNAIPINTLESGILLTVPRSIGTLGDLIRLRSDSKTEPQKNAVAHITDSSTKTEISNLVEEVSPPAINHPWVHLLGKYDDEPAWDDFIEAIRDYRVSLRDQEETAE